MGELTLGSCELSFKIQIDKDLYQKHYNELNGEFTEDVEMDLIRSIMDITVEREGISIVLSDEAYSFLNMLLSTMMDRFDAMSDEETGKEKTAYFSGYWDFPARINEYLPPTLFPGIQMVVQ